MTRIAIAAAWLLAVAALVALGLWQLERRNWKHRLIVQVEQRLAAQPVPVPGPESWRAIGPDDAYRRVRVEGRLRADGQTFVQAVTALGPGFWVMAPVETDRGFTLLVNRGFVPSGGKVLARGGMRRVALTGLLRLSEPRGGFLRKNRPQEDRWYSRDVAAIAARVGATRVAPYFVDADAAPGGGWPRGGLTIVRFPDNHLQYALTWFAMAALLAGAGLWMARRPRAA